MSAATALAAALLALGETLHGYLIGISFRISVRGDARFF
jgi:hypothetical protein